MVGTGGNGGILGLGLPPGTAGTGGTGGTLIGENGHDGA
ncbi:PE-PRGS family protein [Mycobacterium sp. 012931]|nr:PE-PRGS family protein [Mycobacterium sp. 012931]